MTFQDTTTGGISVDWSALRRWTTWQKLWEIAESLRRFFIYTSILTTSTFGWEDWWKTSCPAPEPAHCSPAWSESKWSFCVTEIGTKTFLLHIKPEAEAEAAHVFGFLLQVLVGSGRRVHPAAAGAAVENFSVSDHLWELGHPGDSCGSLQAGSVPGRLPSLQRHPGPEPGGLERRAESRWVHRHEPLTSDVQHADGTNCCCFRPATVWLSAARRQRRFPVFLQIWKADGSVRLFPWFPARGRHWGGVWRRRVERWPA